MLETKQAKKSIGTVMLAIAFIFLVTVVLQIMFVLVFAFVAPELLENDVFNTLSGSGIMYGIAMPLSLFIFQLGSPVMKPERRSISVVDWIVIFSVCFASTILLSVLGNAINEWFKTLLGQPPVNDIEEATRDLPFWCNLLVLAILAPIFEELFLRKLVIDRLLPYGELPAILLSGIAFGLVHGNFSQFFYAALTGIIFGFVYVKTGNIWINISLHALLNFIGGVYTTELQKLLDGQALGGPLAWIPPQFAATLMNLAYLAILGFTFAVAFASLLSAIIQKKKLNLKKSDFTPGQWVGILLRNVPLWIFLVCVAIMFVI